MCNVTVLDIVKRLKKIEKEIKNIEISEGIVVKDGFIELLGCPYVFASLPKDCNVSLPTLSTDVQVGYYAETWLKGVLDDIMFVVENRQLIVDQEKGHISSYAARELKANGFRLDKVIVDEGKDPFNIQVYTDIGNWRVFFYMDGPYTKAMEISTVDLYRLNWFGKLLQPFIYK